MCCSAGWRKTGKSSESRRDCTPTKTKHGKSKRGTPRQSVASVRSSKALTDRETEAPSAQTQETTGQKTSICPSVQSVRENADTNGARSSVPAQTDRTDRQTS